MMQEEICFVEGVVTPSRACKDSLCTKISRVYPMDLNEDGNLFGGRLMAHIDDVASISAERHACVQIVTASTDSVDFLSPIGQTDVLCLTSYVTWAGFSSMEVFVKVVAENLKAGTKRIAATAFLTFVALGADGKPFRIPQVVPHSEEEKKLYETAPSRAMARKQHRLESTELADYLTY